MRQRRLKVGGREAIYHCMTRTVNGELLFEDREKEMLRKMMHQVADFCGVQVLTFCIMSNHFHVLVKVPDAPQVSDQELMRRYKVLYPKPTKYQAESAKQMELLLLAGGDDAEVIRSKLLARVIIRDRLNKIDLNLNSEQCLSHSNAPTTSKSRRQGSDLSLYDSSNN